MKIQITPYSTSWIKGFKNESQVLQTVFKEPVIIEHIGSTSISGLAAKPIIDIMIGLTNFQTAGEHVSSINRLGYEYISKYEKEMPYRKFFIKMDNGKRTHHIHMVEIDSEFWKRHLLFRDYLRNNEQARNEYAKLKQRLALCEWTDGDEYAAAKSDFIRRIENRARRKAETNL